MFSQSIILFRTFRSGITELSPGILDSIKLLAFLTMLLDHFNTIFLSPARPELYAVGRMAFPLFILVWAINVLKKPEKLQQNANRLWLWAIATQPVFALAFRDVHPWYALNILFVFAGVTQLLALARTKRLSAILSGLLLLCAMTPLLTPASYGLQGLVLATGAALYLSPHVNRYRTIVGILVVGALLTLNGITHLATRPADTLLMAILPTMVFPAIAVSLIQNYVPVSVKRFMPPRFFYFAYPGHLALLALALWIPVS